MNYLINQVVPRTQKRSDLVWPRLQPWTILALVLILFGCASVPHTGRRQFNMVPDSELNALGVKAFNEVAAREPESKDQRLKEIVGRVADRVSKAAESMDNPGFDWEVRVIDKDVPNAFCLPGGKIVVYSGIVPYAKNETGLAAILAHEVAHAVARHGGERLSQQVALEGALGLGAKIMRKKDGTLDKKSRDFLGQLGMGGTIGVVLPYSRTHEFEADRIGQIYMARAGYDPEEAIRVWERMSKIDKPPIPVWLSTHPADQERVRKLKEMLPDARKYYEEAPAKYGTGVML